MKKLISILLSLVLLLSLTACGVDVKEVKANVYGIAGPTGVGLANLMKDAKDG